MFENSQAQISTTQSKIFKINLTWIHLTIQINVSFLFMLKNLKMSHRLKDWDPTAILSQLTFLMSFWTLI